MGINGVIVAEGMEIGFFYMKIIKDELSQHTGIERKGKEIIR